MKSNLPPRKASDLVSLGADPTRPIYVLLHKDHSHLYSKSPTEPVWSHEPAQVEITLKILEKDFKTKDYGVVTLAYALPLIANKQALLVEAWTPTINSMRKTKSLEGRFTLYKKAAKKFGPHPIEADRLLRKLLNL